MGNLIIYMIIDGDLMPKLLKRKESKFEPDICLFSDLHLDDRKDFEKIDSTTGLNIRLVEGLEILDQIFLLKKDYPSIITYLSLGDIFERKDKIPNHILLAFKERLAKKPKDTAFVNLLGNHDSNLKNFSALKIFDTDFFQLIENYFDIPDSKAAFISYQRDFKIFRTLWNEAHLYNLKYLFFHQELPGGVYESGKIIENDLHNLPFNQNITYISGHLHLPQKVGQVLYLGSPYPTKFLDKPRDHFIYLLNSQTNEMKEVKLNYSDFITLPPFSDIDPSDVFNNYIRIKGEINQQDWSMEIRDKIKKDLESYGAKAIIFDVKVRRQKTKTKISSARTDDEIIKEYFIAEAKEQKLDGEKAVTTALEIFENVNQN